MPTNTQLDIIRRAIANGTATAMQVAWLRAYESKRNAR